MPTTTTITPAIELSVLSNDENTATSQARTSEIAMTVQDIEQQERLPYLKMFSAGYSFFVAGINDGSLGPIIPYLLREYSVGTGRLSIVYAASCTGWLVAAILNTHLTHYLSLGSLLLIGAILQTLGSSLRTFTPNFALFCVTFFIISLGQALQDAHANTFVAEVSRKGTAHRWLGFIHACYMGGCLVSPFVATAVAGTGRWALFYVFPSGLGIVNVLLVAAAFRDLLNEQSWKAKTTQQGRESQEERQPKATKQIAATLKLKNMWLLSLFFFFYLGVAMTAGGWIIEYLVTERNGDVKQMGYVSAGFNGGCFLGRVLLPEITNRWGEKKMVFGYCVFALAMQLCFWLVPDIMVAAIAITLLGFFTGPFFATAMSLGTSLFSQDLHSTALAFVFVFAQIGGSIFPIVTGVLATRFGVKVLQPVLVGLIVAMGASWLLIPRRKLVHAE